MANRLLYNEDRHKECFCNKTCDEPAAKLMLFPAESRGHVNISKSEILFVLDGSGRITLENIHLSCNLAKGEFIFLPAGTRLTCNFNKDSAIIVVRMIVNTPECQATRIDAAVKPATDGVTPGIHSLKVNKRIQHFLSGLRATIEDGFMCELYMQSEVARLLMLIHAYYSPQECADFFAHIMSADVKFSEFVRTNYQKYKTVAQMAETLNMTTQAFSSYFKKIFGMPPHKWMQREKARLIYLDICRSDIPLKEIAMKHEFPIPSNFFRFCKNSFGDSPGNIRKNLRNNPAYINHN